MKKIVAFIADQLKKSVTVLALGTALLAGLVVVVALVSKLISPQAMIIVQPFEISDGTSKRLGISGKTATDVFVDRLNELARDGSIFHGNDYSSSSHYGRLPELIKIPVESTYSIELKGISVDDLLRLYRRLRYQQWLVSGDMIPLNDSVNIYVRWDKTGNSEGWKIHDPSSTSVEDVIREAAERFLSSAHPELAGRAYLQEKKYDDAKTAFRAWIRSEPCNPVPYYYLSLTYMYQGDSENSIKAQTQDREDSAALAQWSQNVAKLGGQMTNGTSYQFGMRLWGIARGLFSSSSDTADRDAALIASKMLESQSYADIHAAEQKFGELMGRHPADVVYRIDFGVAEDRLGALDWKNQDIARHDFDLELTRLEQAGQLEPDNAGIERNIGSTFYNLGRLDEEIQRKADWRQGLQHELKALQLRPDFSAALIDATNISLSLNGSRETARLCRTILLLQGRTSEGAPDARTEYGIALAADGSFAEAVKVAQGDPQIYSPSAASLRLIQAAKDQRQEKVASDLLNYATSQLPKDQGVRELAEAANKTKEPNLGYLRLPLAKYARHSEQAKKANR